MRKRTVAALIAFVALSAGVHFTLGPVMTSMSPRFDTNLIPKQEVAIITLSRRIVEQALPKPTPTPTPPPMPFPRTHREVALLKYREFGASTDRRSIVRTPARRVATIEIRSNQHVLPRSDEPDAKVVVAVPVPTPQQSEPPGSSKTSTAGADMQAASVWGDDNPPRIIKRAALAIVDGATGTATVEVDINTDGSVADVKLLQSSGDPAVDQAALDAARASTFAPATVNGLPVHGTLTIDYAPTTSSST